MLMFLKNQRFCAELFIHRQSAFRTCAKTLYQTVPTSLCLVLGFGNDFISSVPHFLILQQTDEEEVFILLNSDVDPSAL